MAQNDVVIYPQERPMFHTRLAGLVACLALLAAPTALHAQTPPAKAANAPAKAAKNVALPPAIDAAFKKVLPTATVRNVSKEKENGREQVEVESTDHGKARDLIYLSDGTLLEMEDELSEAEWPAAASAAIKARYPSATISKREKLTILKGHVVQYEASLTGAKVKEVVLTAEGKWVSPK
jgi:hypothetical protein